MVMRAVPVDVLTRYLGGEATREVIKRCTQGPVIAKKGSNGSFLFPLVHPQVVRHAEALGISPHIEANAVLYLEESGNGKLDYVVAVGEERAIIGYGEFGIVSDQFRLVTAQRLSLWYTYETGGIHLTHLEDGINVVQAPPQIVEMSGEELEQLVEKYAPKGVSEEEVIRRVAEFTKELRKESAQLEQRNRDLETRLTAANAVRTKSERELATERSVKEDLEEKLAEKKGEYASLRKTYEDLVARKPELGKVQEELERLRRRVAELEAAGTGQRKGKPVSDYPAEITSQKDRFLYDLAKSLMRKCVERGRYKENDIVGLGWNDGQLHQTTWQKFFSFYLIKEQELGIIATSDPTANTDPIGAVRQKYYAATKQYPDLFPEFRMGKIPAYAVLFLQLAAFGPGSAKAKDLITGQLGFTQEQISTAVEQGLFTEAGSGNIEKLSLNATMRLVYPLFMKYRKELEEAVSEPTSAQPPAASHNFFYELAKSLMQKCIERKRYRVGEGNKAELGIGLTDAKLRYVPINTEIRFASIVEKSDLDRIAATEDTSKSIDDRRKAIRQHYMKSLERGEYGSLFYLPSDEQRSLQKIPAVAVLLFQLINFGKGYAKQEEQVQKQLGFTTEQIEEGIQNGIFQRKGTAILRSTLNTAMKDVYAVFLAHHEELYQKCTAGK